MADKIKMKMTERGTALKCTSVPVCGLEHEILVAIHMFIVNPQHKKCIPIALSPVQQDTF
jgi:hypothetical protein